MVFKITKNGIEDNIVDNATLINASSSNDIVFNSKRFIIQIQYSETYPLTNNECIINITNTEIQQYDSIISNISTNISSIHTHVYNIQTNSCKLAIYNMDTEQYTGLLDVIIYIMT